MPGFIPPALATLKAATPEGTGWLHEVKFDGYRIQAHISAGKLKLFTRSGLDWTPRFGEPLRRELLELKCNQAILDGEIVVLAGNGVASHYNGIVVHLAHRDISFVTVSKAPIEQIEQFREANGLDVPLGFFGSNDFGRDFGVSFTDQELADDKTVYNFNRQP